MSTEKHVHENHDHEHGEGCGHVSFTHGDHTDYVHDGHIHRKVDGKWVECEPDGHVVAEDHGDHVDYIHDGHRHAAHGDHYDEH